MECWGFCLVWVGGEKLENDEKKNYKQQGTGFAHFLEKHPLIIRRTLGDGGLLTERRNFSVLENTMITGDIWALMIWMLGKICIILPEPVLNAGWYNLAFKIENFIKCLKYWSQRSYQELQNPNILMQRLWETANDLLKFIEIRRWQANQTSKRMG